MGFFVGGNDDVESSQTISSGGELLRLNSLLPDWVPDHVRLRATLVRQAPLFLILEFAERAPATLARLRNPTTR